MIEEFFYKVKKNYFLLEGQLPKGSAYLDSEEYNMDKENKIRGSTAKRNVETEEISEYNFYFNQPIIIRYFSTAYCSIQCILCI